jgi:uncharacterized membrane protein YbhN (UPF0104 family)
MRRGAGVALRLAVGLGALAWLVTRIDPGLARSTLSSADPAWLAAALGGQIGAKLFWLLRWDELLASTGHRRPLGRLLRWILVGLFFNNFLPSSVGGDVARGLGLAGDGVPRATAAASVVLDRLIGMVALCVMAVAGGALGRMLWPGEGPWGAAALCALAAAILLFALLRPGVLGRLARARGLPEAVASRARRLLDAMALVSGRGEVVARALAHSLGLSACSAFFHWSVARALDLPVPLLAFFVIVPTVMLFASLPITLNGLGIREVGFVAFLGAQGAPPSVSAVFAFLVFALPLLFALAGGALFLAGSRPAAARRGSGGT